MKEIFSAEKYFSKVCTMGKKHCQKFCEKNIKKIAHINNVI
jgi:hypothetical protein